MRDTHGPHNIQFLSPANNKQEESIQTAIILKIRNNIKT